MQRCLQLHHRHDDDALIPLFFGENWCKETLSSRQIAESPLITVVVVVSSFTVLQKVPLLLPQEVDCVSPAQTSFYSLSAGECRIIIFREGKSSAINYLEKTIKRKPGHFVRRIFIFSVFRFSLSNSKGKFFLSSYPLWHAFYDIKTTNKTRQSPLAHHIPSHAAASLLLVTLWQNLLSMRLLHQQLSYQSSKTSSSSSTAAAVPSPQSLAAAAAAVVSLTAAEKLHGCCKTWRVRETNIIVVMQHARRRIYRTNIKYLGKIAASRQAVCMS